MMLRHYINKLILCVLCLPYALNCLAAELHFVTEDLPPFQQVEKGKLVGGAMVELIEALVAVTGVKATINAYPWSRAYKLALQQPNTLIFSIRRTQAREELFYWLGHLYTIRTQLAILAERTDIQVNSVDDLRDYSVGVVRGDYDQFFLEQQGIKGKTYLALSYKELWQMLKLGRFDCVLTNQVTSALVLNQLGISKQEIKIAFEFEQAENQLFLAANKHTDPTLVARLTKGFESLKANGTYEKIMNKWQL